MKSIRKQNCILAIVMFALMSILTSFPVQAQTINQKQAKVTVQYASIPAKVETSSSGDIFITVKNISDDYRVDYDMRVLNNKGNVVEVSEQNGGITYFSYLKRKIVYIIIRYERHGLRLIHGKRILQVNGRKKFHLLSLNISSAK